MAENKLMLVTEVHVLNVGQYLVPVIVTPGERIRMRMPSSEVCMHMGVADHEMLVELLVNQRGHHSAQLYYLNGQPFSSPITTGEAGFYYSSDRKQYYAYKEVGGVVYHRDSLLNR